jgi:flagellar motility protein MotE (MotC chaperone)
LSNFYRFGDRIFWVLWWDKRRSHFNGLNLWYLFLKLEQITMNCTQEVQKQLEDSLQQLSPERLQVVADFAAYLVDAESEAATQELLAIPGLLDRVKQCEATPKADYKNWRELRSDAFSRRDL